MALDWRNAQQTVVVSVVTAAVLGALTYVLSWSYEGGLIHLLGGATAKEVEAIAKTGSLGGAVVAFDQEKCPDGWSAFPDAAARVIVGYGSDPKTKSQYKYRESIGKKTEFIVLEAVPAGSAGPEPPPPFNRRLGVSGQEHEGITNMPPFIALLYCKRDYKKN